MMSTERHLSIYFKTSSKNLTSHLACCELFPCCSMRHKIESEANSKY